MQIYTFDTGELMYGARYGTQVPPAVGFSSDNQLLAMCRSTKEGVQIDVIPADKAQTRTYKVSHSREVQIHALTFIEGKHWLALAGGKLPLGGSDDVGTVWYKDQGGVIILLDAETGREITRHKFNSYVTCLAISQDGSRVVAGMYDGQVAVTALH